MGNVTFSGKVSDSCVPWRNYWYLISIIHPGIIPQLRTVPTTTLSYILTFDFNNGTTPEVRRVEYYSKITYPSTPTKRDPPSIGGTRISAPCLLRT